MQFGQLGPIRTIAGPTLPGVIAGPCQPVRVQASPAKSLTVYSTGVTVLFPVFRRLSVRFVGETNVKLVRVMDSIMGSSM